MKAKISVQEGQKFVRKARNLESQKTLKWPRLKFLPQQRRTSLRPCSLLSTNDITALKFHLVCCPVIYGKKCRCSKLCFAVVRRYYGRNFNGLGFRFSRYQWVHGRWTLLYTFFYTWSDLMICNRGKCIKECNDHEWVVSSQNLETKNFAKNSNH